VAQRKDQLTLLDVRSAEAIIGPDGPIGGSRLIPLPKTGGALRRNSP
jgi:hypothetical protein